MNSPRDILRAALDPKSVAIVGASDNPNKIGGRPIRYMTRYGYKGEILPYRASNDDKIAREAAMAVGETSGQASDTGRKVVSSAGPRAAAEGTEPARLVREADPELEKLLDEEETITRQTREANETPHFRGDD